MSWLQDLYDTYNSNIQSVGKIEVKASGQAFTLLPISHTTQNAHIELLVTPDGEFYSAKVLTKDTSNTLIPCTEESASRSANVAPYPLHDKLQYVAGDYQKYGGIVKSKENPFLKYMKQLEEWSTREDAHWKIKSIYSYVSKGTLIEDLIAKGILHEDNQNQLIKKWDKKYEENGKVKPEIFGLLPGEQEAAFIRFSVHVAGEHYTPVWEDHEVFQSFIHYYNEKLGDIDYCYVTGKLQARTERHANKIRHAADKAKLISSNDKTGFTFRGRFDRSEEAASISYEVSQKAHNALKWLIHRQGYSISERIYLVWGNNQLDVPHFSDDGASMFSELFEHEDQTDNQVIVTNTSERLANEYKRVLKGLQGDLEHVSKVNILLLDSATTGRMGVLYYRNMDHKDYFDRLIRWHSTCRWTHRYRKGMTLVGAPSLRDIAIASYGTHSSDDLIKKVIERLVPCVVDGLPIPFDIMQQAVQKASNPVAFKEKWEWEKTLSIACALVNSREGKEMALDDNNTSRDYLFGRLLAVADVFERSAMDNDKVRSTNAVRYMNSFARYPARTWMTIQNSLQPYQAKLGGRSVYFTKLIDGILSKFEDGDFDNRVLEPTYLLGLSCQRQSIYDGNKDKELINENQIDSE